MKSRARMALTALLLASTAMAASSGGALAAGFKVINLVSDIPGKAAVTDPNLVNAWGLSQAPGGPVWVSDNGTNLSTVYNRTTGQISSIVVNIPMGAPTGTVYAQSSLAFNVTENGKTGAATFLFDTESGAIEGWSNSVDATNAVIAVDNSGSGAVYKGLAIDTNAVEIFAANFSNSKVEVYNNKFQLVNSFTDKTLPKAYAPFNIMDDNGTLYVAFAKRDKAHHDEIDGAGLGYIDTFDLNGNMLKRLVSNGVLNAPWGLAIAPSGFGAFANDLLVGNFGNGKINVFDPSSGAMLGTLTNPKGKTIKIGGLWALDSGPNNNQVNFSAGTNAEADGLFGLIQAK